MHPIFAIYSKYILEGYCEVFLLSCAVEQDFENLEATLFFFICVMAFKCDTKRERAADKM